MDHSKRSTGGVRLLRALLLAAFGIVAASGADSSTVTYPFLGVTHIFRTLSAPDFPRNARVHIVKIDLTAPGISFRLPPKAGTRDTLKLRTLTYADNVGAQVALNMQFFNPVTSPAVAGGISADTNTEIIGFGASAGTVISPFERPFQNYAIVRDSPAINIDPNNNVSILTAAPGFSDGSCESCLNNDGLHVNETNVTVWNAVTGSGQIVTNGVRTIPCYIDATHPNCQLDGSLSPGSVAPPYSNAKSWYELINARASLGFSQDGKTLFLFSVDAAGGSTGMTVLEVADMMISYGAYQALNMDGGGSVSMVFENPTTHVRSLVNTSSNGPFAREVANSLAVFASSSTDVTHTVNASPVGPGFSVDGTDYTTGQSPVWSYGSTHTLATTTPQFGPGTRYLFLNWSDGGAISHPVSGAATSQNYKANFQTQYQLTTAASGPGSVSPVSGAYYDAGTTVNLQATANPGYAFQSWSGPVASPGSAATTTLMSAPNSITANFIPGPTTLTGLIGARSGPTGGVRIWTVNLVSTGPGVALSPKIDAFDLVQTGGVACSPAIGSSLPVSLPDLTPGSTGSANLTIDFAGCAANARFTANFSYSANGGAATGSKAIFNQFQ